MATNKKAKTQKKKKTVNSPTYVPELFAFIFFLLFMLAFFKLGFLGMVLANLVRFFFGDLFGFACILGAWLCLFRIVKGRLPYLSGRWALAFLAISVASLVISHLMAFSGLSIRGSQVMAETLARFSIDFKLNQMTHWLGGGILGAFFYTLSSFLIGNWGTYLLVALLYFSALCLAFDIHYGQIVAFIQDQGQALGQRIDQYRQDRQEYLDQQEAPVKVARPKPRPQAPVVSDPSPQVETASPALKKKESFLDRMKGLVFQDEEWEDQESERDWTSDEGKEDLEWPQTKPKSNRGSNFPLEVEEWEQSSYPQLDQDQPVQEDQEDLPSFKAPQAPQAKPRIQEEEEEEDLEPVELALQEGQEDAYYQLPPLDLLNPVKVQDQSDELQIVQKNMRILEQTFASFGVEAKVMPEPLIGPAVTKFEIKPAIGVKVSKIVNLSDDIALALAAKDIRIEAPIPGKPYVGIEVPNKSTSFVSFSDVIQAALRSPKPLDVPLGRDISGNVRLCDISKMPHMLIAGSTGSGKSVCINGIITSILMKTKPSEVKLMMIDPKMVELNVYNGIPHLLTPVVTNPRKAAQALQKVVAEMEKRYELFATLGMRNIDGYNAQVEAYNAESGEGHQKLPYIVVIVDELADLMMVASNEVEDAIIRLAQMARAAGIHMILATQRPSVDVITGIIKANVPSRIAFAVSSGTDSRTIIDASGAEKLLGRGDMLYMPMGENKPIRVQGAYLDDAEVERIVEFVKTQQEAQYDEDMMPSEGAKTTSEEPEDDLFLQVVEMLKEQETVSTSFIQRRFRIGFNRAARMIDELEARGYIGPNEGSKPRKVNVHIFQENSDSDPVENKS